MNPYRDSNTDPSAVQPVTSRYTDCVVPAMYRYVVVLFELVGISVKFGHWNLSPLASTVLKVLTPST
jgi:hypothetical protein